MANTKKQHFVPQCYLEAFADGNRRIHVFDKFECTSFTTGIKDIAQKHRFYDLVQDDKNITSRAEGDVLFAFKLKGDIPNSKAIEETLSALEGEYASVFRDVQQTIAHRQPLTKAQKSILSHFIAIQWQRTPEYRRTLIELYENVTSWVWKVTHEGEKKRFVYDERYASFIQAYNMFHPSGINKFIQVLMSHIWMVGLNTSDISLYTSDQPIVKMSRGDLQGFGSLGIQITVPLTPRNALIICDKNTFLSLACMGYENNYIDLDRESVKHYNSLQVRDSYRHVFSKDGDFLFATEYCANNPGVRIPMEHHWKTNL